MATAFIVLIIIAILFFVAAAIPIPGNTVGLGWIGCVFAAVAFLVGR